MARVLIVDDSPTDIIRFADCLTRNGHEVLTATDGQQGIAMANRGRPDVVLMDVVMPGLNGFQATRELTLNEGTRHIPVIIVSSKNQETDMLWGRRQGASGYLVKPVGERTLIDELNRVLTEQTA